VRAGTYALSVLAVPLNVHVVRALEQEQTSLIDLRRAVGSPPQTTMRSHLRTLTDLGVLERRRQNEFPGSLDYELTRPGRELLAVAVLLQAWLADSPQGPLSLGGDAAKKAVKALIDGWSSAIVRALAAGPLSLTDLSRLISSLNYPSLERRLAAMRQTGQVEPQLGKTRATPYVVTDWLRRSVAPLAAAARWERRHVPDSTMPIARIDIESAFLLAVPLATVGNEASGSCRLAVEVRNGGHDLGLAGVQIGLKDGRVESCFARLEGSVDASISGTVSSWIRAVAERDADGLEIGGESRLGCGVLEGLNMAMVKLERRT
jgi:DNA-binding HxlR family transcriptional regulator